MQKTRLNILLVLALEKVNNFLVNPWRTISLNIIFLLFGFFISSLVCSIFGQKATLDPIIALGLLIFTETVSILTYKLDYKNNGWVKFYFLNTLKIGVVYGLFLEAAKLNS